MTVHFSTRDPLLARILGRDRSLFAADVEANRRRLEDAIGGKRLLIVGAAGSIGGAFVKQVLGFRPASAVLVDLDENTMVELVRDIRSSGLALPAEFRTVSVDFGQAEFLRMAQAWGPFDVFVNFSAVKHVRSERDVYSLLRMIEVNVGALARFLASDSAKGLTRAFSVSTDKSVCPANLMGATKNLMEKVLFSQGGAPIANSARFANVAFSAGSLLEGFEQRLAKGQPLAGPSDVRRYFISHEEAGQLCLLGAFLGEDRQVVFPRLDPDADLMRFSDIAVAFLAHHGFKPRFCASEEEARLTPPQAGTWPCFFSASDTTGEKAFEEFHRSTDALDTATFREVALVREAPVDPAIVTGFLERIDAIRTGSTWDKAAVVGAIRAAVPELEHLETGRFLDQKM